MMTKRDYIAVAAVVKTQRDQACTLGLNARMMALHYVDGMAQDLADVFKADNDAFDRSTFLTACGTLPAPKGTK
jgi:hypothetical protein